MNQATVLITEGEDETRDFLRNTVLQPIGCRVLTAADGREGLQRALDDRPDLILLNLVLPHLSGLAMLSQLQQQNCHIPAIVLTARGAEQATLQAFRLGARDFLQEPFQASEVRSVVENALTERRLRQEKESLTQALAKTNERLQQQLHNWVALNDIAQAITSTLDERAVFQLVLENVNRILRVELGSLLLLDQETDELEFQVTLNGEAARFSTLRRKPGHEIASWVVHHGQPLLIPDVCQDPRFHAQLGEITGFPHLSVLCVPLKTQWQVIGAIEVINKRAEPQGSPFDQEDLGLLTTLASWVAVAVENARLNRVTRKTAAVNAFKQTTATVAHHINNQLMAFSLELESLESCIETGCPVDEREKAVGALIVSAHRCIQEISAVVKAMDRLAEIRTRPYVGAEKMIDIEDALDEQLRRVTAPGSPA